MNQPQPVAKILGGLTEDTLTGTQLDTILDMVTNGRKDQNPNMSESLFRDYFLPVLAGVREDAEALRIYTQGVAGPNIGVNILDSLGNFMYEVPPLFSTDHIKALPDKKDAPTFGLILQNVELMRHRSPRQSQEMLRVGLYQRVVKAHVKNYKHTANEARWLEIFKRYGYDVTPTAILADENHGNTTSPNTGTVQSNNAAPASGEPIEFIGEY